MVNLIFTVRIWFNCKFENKVQYSYQKLTRKTVLHGLKNYYLNRNSNQFEIPEWSTTRKT